MLFSAAALVIALVSPVGIDVETEDGRDRSL